MNDARKSSLIWGVVMALLFGLLFVLQYRETPKWTEAIQPGLVITTFGFVLKTFADVYSLIFSQRGLDLWSYIAFGIALVCLLSLWALGGTANAILFILGYALVFLVIALVTNWLKRR